MSSGAKKPAPARVALETTLLCHGLPRAQALEVADRLAAIVRHHGAEPMLIGVVDGEVQAGMSRAALKNMLAQESVEKIGARGIAGAVARGVFAATTVSATMAIAAANGIQVFATGGLGGVHREAAESFDESEDLAALSRYPVAVVSAGAKAILDLDKTVQRLETLGVPVVGFGTDQFTAFYTNHSPLRVAERIDEIEALAKLAALRIKGTYGHGGLLVVNRVPEAFDLGAAVMTQVEQAVAHAQRIGAHGAQATPAALAYLNQQDAGKFLRTNIAVVEANAKLAAQLAVAMAGLRATRAKEAAHG